MLRHKAIDLNEFAKTMAGEAIVEQSSQSAREICGVLVVTDEGYRAIELPNHYQPDPDIEDDDDIVPDRFAMGPEFEAFRDSAAIVYHSHVGDDCGAELSDADIANSSELGIPYLVYHPGHDQWDFFDPEALHPFPAEIAGLDPDGLAYFCRWRFRYGRSDCWRLVRSWYAHALKIDLGDNPRTEFRLTHGQFGEDAAREKRLHPIGATQISDEGVRDGDILLMNILGGRENHSAVVVDATRNLILHTLGGDAVSRVDDYDTAWRSRTARVYRHQDLLKPANS